MSLKLMMDSITYFLLEVYASYVKSRFTFKTCNIERSQERFLKRFIRDHQNTELGQKLGLRNITTIDQFRSQIPILPYEYYQPFVDRIAAGEENILNPDRVTYISLTSGTTGNKKKVPVTQRFQTSLRKANIATMGFFFAGLKRRGLKFGKMLITNSATLQGKTTGGINYGPVTVGSLRQGQPLFEKTFTLPFATLEITDTFARHYVAILLALQNTQMRGIIASFPMLLLRTCNYLADHAESLIRDLEQGQIDPDLDLEPNRRRQLQKYLTASPTRAAELRQILKQHGRLTPLLAWPELSYVCTAMGGTTDFYLEQFPSYFGPTPVFGGVFGTAEGTFGVYPDLDTEGSVLAIESGFFEFIPEDQWHVDQPQTLLPRDLEVGKRYRLLVTSYSGFYRYDIGDVIEVLGFYNQAPLIVFRHRRGGLLSSTTEKTTEFHVTQVMQKLQQEFGLQLEDFCITLSAQDLPARYLVNVELASGQTLDNPHEFLERFEYWLGEFNNPYRTVRGADVPPPQLRVLCQGSFAEVRQRRIDSGMFDSQLKIPHISEDRRYLVDLQIEQVVDLEPEVLSTTQVT